MKSLNFCFAFLFTILTAYSQVHFSEKSIYKALYQTQTATIDFNHDGYTDLLLFSTFEGRAIVFENMLISGFSKTYEFSIPNTHLGNVTLVGDVNGDYYSDLLLSIGDSNFYSFLNNFGSSFNSGAFHTGINQPYSFLLDYDFDMDNDIMYSLADSVYIMRNNGFGNFSSPEVLLLAPNIIVTNIIDVDLDGDFDIVGLELLPPYKLICYPNTGNGSFGVRVDILEGEIPGNINFADLDYDLDLDIIYSDILSGNLSYLRNLGNGSYSSPNTIVYSNSNSTKSLLLFDLDNDGDEDIVYKKAVIGDHGIEYVKNDGFGNFSQGIEIDSGDVVGDIVLSDVDRDGYIDLVAVSRCYQIGWYRNLSGTGFNEISILVSDYGLPSALDYIDVTGDTIEEVVLSGQSGLYYFSNNYSNFIFIDTICEYAVQNFFDSEWGDIDNDGDNDMIAVNGSVYWFENNSSGASFTPHLVDSSPNAAEKIKIMDMDNDGDLDLIYGAQDQIPSTHIIITKVSFNDGLGNFSVLSNIYSISNSLRDIYLYDYNYDGLKDIFQIGLASNVKLFLNQGGGLFTKDSTTFNFEAFDIQFDDIDGDTIIDLIFSRRTTMNSMSYIVWYKGNGNGTYNLMPFISTAQKWPRKLIFSDIDKDGDLDLFSTYLDSETKVGFFTMQNAGNGSFDNLHVIPDVYTNENVRDLIPADIDNDGDIDYLTLNEFYSSIAIENLGYQNIDSAVVCANEGFVWQNQLYTSPGYYYNSMYSIYGLDSADVLFLEHIPIPDVTIDPFWADTFCIQSGSTLLPTAIPVGGNYSGLGVNSTGIDFGITSTGNHELYYTYLDTITGCSNSDTIAYSVKDCILISDLKDFNFEIYPNPTQNNIVVDIQKLSIIQDFTIILNDQNGRIIFKKVYKSFPVELDLNRLNSGAYILSIFSETGKVSYSIIKE